MVTAGKLIEHLETPPALKCPHETALGDAIASVLVEDLTKAMTKILKSAIPAAILAAGLLWVGAAPSYAKPEYAKTEGKACTFCHVTNGKPELNEAGHYYAAHDHSLAGYTPAK